MQIQKFISAIRLLFRISPGVFLVVFGTRSHASDTLVVEDLRPSWIYPNGEEWDPLVDISGIKTLLIPVSKPSAEEDLIVVIKSSQNLDIWINDRLIMIDTQSWNSSLSNLFKEHDSDQIIIQLTSKWGFEQVQTHLVKATPTIAAPLDSGSLRKRAKVGFHNFVLIYVLLLVIVTGVFRRFFPLKFYQILKWRPKLRKVDIDENFGGIFTIDNLITILFSCLLLAILGVYHRFHSGYLGSGFREFFALGSYIFFVSVGLYLVKWLVARVFASIFNFRNVYGIQLLEFLNFGSMVLLSAFVLLLLDFTFWEESHWLILKGLGAFLAVAILFFQPWIYLRFNRILPNSKILIISYLCLSEFLPGFLLLVWILG